MCGWVCGFEGQLRTSFTYFGQLLHCAQKRIRELGTIVSRLVYPLKCPTNVASHDPPILAVVFLVFCNLLASLCSLPRKIPNYLHLGKRSEDIENVKYLGSLFDANGGAEKDGNNRIKIAWSKWRETTGVMCDRNIPTKLKDKVYKTAIKPAMVQNVG